MSSRSNRPTGTSPRKSNRYRPPQKPVEEPSTEEIVEPDPELSDTERYLDATDRYEKIIDLQYQTSEAVDNKASKLSRLLAIFIGILVTASGSLNRANVVSGDDVTLFVELHFGVGIFLLLVSIWYAIRTYLSSEYVFGPGPVAAKAIATDRIRERYARSILAKYGSAVDDNRSELDTNASLFNYAQSAFFVGICFLILSALFLISDLSDQAQQALTVIIVPLLVFEFFRLLDFVQIYGSDDAT